MCLVCCTSRFCQQLEPMCCERESLLRCVPCTSSGQSAEWTIPPPRCDSAREAPTVVGEGALSTNAELDSEGVFIAGSALLSLATCTLPPSANDVQRLRALTTEAQFGVVYPTSLYLLLARMLHERPEQRLSVKECAQFLGDFCSCQTTRHLSEMSTRPVALVDSSAQSFAPSPQLALSVTTPSREEAGASRGRFSVVSTDLPLAASASPSRSSVATSGSWNVAGAESVAGAVTSPMSIVTRLPRRIGSAPLPERSTQFALVRHRFLLADSIIYA